MINVAFVSSVAVIAAEPPATRRLFLDVLGLPLAAHDTDDYFSSEAIPGSKHFGVWPLAQAAEACFGTTEWPADRPVPQASIEFDVADEAAVTAAAGELTAAGYSPAAPGPDRALGSDSGPGPERGRGHRGRLVRALDARSGLRSRRWGKPSGVIGPIEHADLVAGHGRSLDDDPGGSV